MRVGLTGGIGSGKSTVGEMLREHGFEVIDADRVAREVVAPGQPALAEIAAHFGDEVLAGDGSLDRGALASVVFADPVQREVLEGITHPAIGDEVARRERAALARDPQAVVVLDHPLLIETDQVDDVDALIVVLVDADVRVARLVRHRGMEESDARARMATQVDDTRRREAATWVVRNDGSLAELQAAVDDVADAIRQRLAADGADATQPDR